MSCNAPDRIYAQYRDKPKAVQWYRIVPTIADGLCNGFEQIRQSWDIDSAEGSQLDVIGDIVVIDRSFESQIDFDPDQFGSPSVQFGGSGNQFGSTTGTITSEVSDQIFRLLIKAKIVKNNSATQIDDIIEAMQYITNDAQPQVTDYEDMSFDVVFGGTLDPLTRLVLTQFDIVPRPQGVLFRGFIETPETTFFGAGQFGAEQSQFGSFFS